MSGLDRLRRVTDLFVEGTELFLGMDDEQKPVIVWVNKLNSFEVEEARRDGVAARGLRQVELQKAESPERAAIMARIDKWSDEELAQNRVAQIADEIWLQVINDLEADEEWAEKVAMVRRMPQLLADANAPEDDPRRKELEELNLAYLEEVRVRNERSQREKLEEFKGEDREKLVEAFVEQWEARVSLEEFMAERRITELFMALRDCQAEEIPDGQGGRRWNHARCDHTQRLLDTRSQVKTLPEGVLDKASEVLEGLTVPQRESGNSVAPESSSESSERPSGAEDSTPSSQGETQEGVPTT